MGQERVEALETQQECGHKEQATGEEVPAKTRGDAVDEPGA